jgi:phospholipase C
MRRLFFFSVSVLVAGCAAASEPTPDSQASAQNETERPENDAIASRDRAACKFKRGAMPADTLGKEIPTDADIPIETVVVIMQENRSFDSYFGHLGKYAHRSDIESAPEATSNPENVSDPRSARHAWQHAPRLCMSDTNHEWAGSHLEWNDGKMDGFFQANEGFRESNQPFVDPSELGGERALWWYDERDIPFYYELASTFAIGDHYHSSLLGPTYPNRDYLYAATSRGVTTGHAMKVEGADKDVLIFDELSNRGVTWAIYVDGIPHVPRVGATIGAGFLSRWGGSQIRTMSQFSADARAGTLPHVVFVDANINEDVNGEDEHPPGDIQVGQKFVSDRVHELFASPQWSKLALFITYDEHGGLYDHVPPPPACPPDGIAPVLETAEDGEWPGAFDRLGVRVPFIVVSPFAKPRYVSHRVYDHTSITRFIETKFKLPALTARDANADPLFDFFDFEKPSFARPPVIAPATVDQAELDACRLIFAPPRENGGG